jgi:hypothetical protein
MEQYDDIDRALFALPLEAPPPGLRDSILAITVRAPQPERVGAGLFEVAGAGVALALLAWFTLNIVVNPAFATAINRVLGMFGQVVTNPVVMVSLALGFSAVFIVSMLPLEPVRVRVRAGRS